MEHEKVIEVLKALDNILGSSLKGLDMASMALNYPNLAKVRRVIGGDDDEINHLLTNRAARRAEFQAEQSERLHQQWKEMIAYDKKQGPLQGLAKDLLNVMKAGTGRFTLAELFVKIPTRPSWSPAATIRAIEADLNELVRRGRVYQDTNRINRAPSEPHRHEWFLVSQDERRIFAGLKPSKRYQQNMPKLDVQEYSLGDELAKTKMHKP
jgi:hypothetical protein